MAWNGNFTIFYDNLEPCPELKCIMASNGGSSSIRNIQVPVQERKRRLSMDQIELLERSFQEEKKLEPERKMRLARELDLQPRQVAVWFQNRRARWKAKQLERVYGALKQEFDAISREKKKLQEEVMKLKAELHEKATAASIKGGSTTAQTDSISAEETVESTIVVHSTYSNSRSIDNKCLEGSNCQQMGECNYLLNVEDYDSNLPAYWGVLAGYP